MLPTEGRDKKKQEPVFPEDGDEPKPTDDKNKETEATAAETDGTEGKRD